MKNHKYELVLKETTIDGSDVNETPWITVSTTVDENTLNGFSRSYSAARVHIVRRLFMELLRKII